MTARPTATELLELDLDVRLLWVWFQAWEVEEWDASRIAPFLRIAYFTGYRDALTEAQRGALFRAHGERVPLRERRPRKP
jgi:hypothetical protein